MSKVKPPPIYDSVVDEGGKASLSWTLFFNQLFTGDTGTEWTPTFTNLTTVGTPTITGRYYKIGQKLCFFSVRIVPATSTTSTAGTTYISNLPVTAREYGPCFALSGNLGSNAGMIDSSTNRVYVPAWSAVTVPLVIVGIVEI